MPTQSWTIGSDATCDLVVSNSTVSSRHCRLEHRGSVFVLEDLHSTNGTYVNGERLSGPKNVTSSDRITLGMTQPMPWPALESLPQSASPARDLAAQPDTVIKIGRAPGNTLTIQGANVSSVHAQLSLSPNQIILEDLGSTNGTSVGTVENKVNRAVVQRGDTIFLGSTAFVVGDLIERAKLADEPDVEIPPSKPVPAERARKNPGQPVVPGSPSSSPLMLVLCCLGSLLLAWIGWQIFRSEAGVANQGDTASETVVVTEVAEVSEEDSTEPDVSRAPSASLGGQVEAAEESDDPLVSEADRLARSLFIVVCGNTDGDTSFRAGTAFAVNDRYVSTSASVIAIMRDLNQNGFPNTQLYNPETGMKIGIGSSRLHPQYERATADARAAQQEHDQILDQLDSETPDPEELEKAKQPLLTARLKAINALERQTAYDVGVMEVDGTLAYWLEGYDSIASLRPKLKLNVVGFAHDVEDPYFDPVSPVRLSEMTGRVDQVVQWNKESLERLTVTGSAEQLEYSFLGCPVLNDLGQVVAVYSRPAWLDPASANSQEPTVADAFAAPLFVRIRECLENLP